MLLTKYCYGDRTKGDELGGACDACGGEEKLIQGLVGEPEGNRLLGRSRRRSENIKLDLNRDSM